MLNDFSEIGLSVVKNLNTRTLNASLKKLAENDLAILPANNYIPKIWENRWYNDSTVAGYQRGDIVWKWTMNEQAFITNYCELIRKYAAANAMLCSYFSYGGTNWAQLYAEVQKYRNVISGYSETVTIKIRKADGSGNTTTQLSTYVKQYFPPMFDYCYDYDGVPGYKPEMPGKKVQIYVSLADNNKSLLSDTTAWKNVTIRTNDEMSAYLSSEFSKMIADHVRDYHMGGAKTFDDYDSLLLAKNLSNFNISGVYNTLKIYDHGRYVNSQGVDYVMRFAKQSQPISVIPNASKTAVTNSWVYRWYRLWSSGYLEHGGTIAVPKYSSSYSTKPENYEISVQLDWPEITGDNWRNAPIYDYQRYSTSFYENSFSQLYFAKDDSQAVKSTISSGTLNLGLKSRYSITLTPVQFTSSDISATERHISLASFEKISSVAYPEYVNDDKNKTWVNFEIHDQFNNGFKITRPRTADLQDVSSVGFVQYYTTGYVARPNRIYDLALAEIRGIDPVYEYTGKPIEPVFDVIANDGDALDRDINYEVIYESDHTETTDAAKLKVVGKDPWKGELTASFAIKTSIL